MANALYAKGRQAFLTAQIDWSSDEILAMLLDQAAYTPNLGADTFVSDIPSGAIIKRLTHPTEALANKTYVDGVADADDITFHSVTGPSAEFVVVYKYNALDSAARLILFVDTAAGLPVLPNGGDLTVQWDNTAGVKMFKL